MLFFGFFRRQQQVQRSINVGIVGAERIGHRPRYRRQGCLVKNVIHAVARRFQGGRILAQVELAQIDSRADIGEVRPVASRKVINPANTFAAFDKSVCQRRPDEPRNSGDQVDHSSNHSWFLVTRQL